MSDFVSAAPPVSGDRITWADNLGNLLVIEPLALEVEVKTEHGTTDAVRANVYAITAPGESTDYEDQLVFPVALVGQLRQNIGNKVVGRLAQGEKKPGKNAPWILDAATADDIAKAQEWLAKRNTPALTSAAPPF